MGALGDGAGDLVEVKLHRLSVGERQRQGGSRAAPDLDRLSLGDAGQVSAQGGGEVFLNSSIVR